MDFRKGWEKATRASKVLFILIAVYVAASIYIFLWGRLGIVPGLPNLDINAMWIYYAIFSFIVVIVLAVFHLGVDIFNQKKRSDS